MFGYTVYGGTLSFISNILQKITDKEIAVILEG